MCIGDSIIFQYIQTMTKKPFFSVVIPTYNREHFLKATIAITLLQTFKDFEIIISNNCSTDNTREVVKTFKDKRIRYFENKKNIGAEPNIKKAMSYARGKYIFSLGDDDFILSEDTLEKVKRIINKKNYGFIRLNLIDRKFIGKGLQKNINHVEHNMEIEKNAQPEEIINFIRTIRGDHIAGLVIKNYKGLSSEFFTFPEIPWIKVIYKNTKMYGAFYIADLYMIITWSQGVILTHYNPRKNNRFMFEEYTDFVFSIIPKKDLSDYKLRYFKKYIVQQPVIKLYSNNRNLLFFNKRLFQLEPRLKQNISFWLFFLTAFLVPKAIWKLVRVVQHKKSNKFEELKNKKKIFNKFNLLYSKYYTTLKQ